MNCQDIDEIAAAYVLGAVPAETASEIEAHLNECPKHTQMIARLRAGAAILPLAVEEKEPPPSLKANLMTAIRSQTLTKPVIKESRRVYSRWRWTSLTPQPIIILLLVISIGLLSWDLVLRLTPEEGLESTFTRTLSGHGDASGRLLYIGYLETAILSVQGLNPLPLGQTYQVWVIDKDSPTSLGLLTISETGQGLTLLSGRISREQTIAITAEPAGGSPRPTTPPVLSSDR